jgi:hypothetical protein
MPLPPILIHRGEFYNTSLLSFNEKFDLFKLCINFAVPKYNSVSSFQEIQRHMHSFERSRL